MTRKRLRPSPPVVPVKERPSATVPQHSHELPSKVVRTLTAALVILVLIIGYAGILQYGTNRRLGQLEDYVAQAKEKRDAQNTLVNERIDIAACGFLDRLPAGPLWDPMREQYHCGPGIPPDIYPGAAAASTAEQFYAQFPQTRDGG